MNKENKIYKKQMENYLEGLNLTISSCQSNIDFAKATIIHEKKQQALAKNAKKKAIETIKLIK